MPSSVYTPALDLIIDLADKAAKGRLALLNSSRVVSAASSAPSRIIRADTGLCRVRGMVPNLSGERAYDYVDLSISTVRMALGVPGAAPYCLATLETPLPPAAAIIRSPQSVTADLAATKRITLDPAPYAGHFIITVDDLDPIEIPYDAAADRVQALLGLFYAVRRRAANAWEISGVEAGQDVVVAVDVSGLLVPKGVTGEMALNTSALAAAFVAAGNPRWLRVYRELEIDGAKFFQDDQVEIAREILNLSALVPTPLPPSDVAAINVALGQKQPIAADLTAIAVLTTTTWGRSLLTLADAGALQTLASLQPLNSQLSALSSLVTAAYGLSLLTASSAPAAKTLLLLDQVTNTADADKPVSTAQAAADNVVALAAAAALAAHAGNAANPHNVTKAQVGLGDAEDTSDLNKPVSTAQQAAIDAVVAALTALLNQKAPLDSPALTGTPTVPTADSAISSTQAASTAFVHAVFAQLLGAPPETLNAIQELAAAIGNDPNFAVTVANSVATKLAKSANLSDLTDVAAALENLGLGNLDNTSDADKPVSTAQAAADTAVAVAAAAALAEVDTAAVHKTGDENIGGAKNFTDQATHHAIESNSVVATVLDTPGAPIVTPIGADEDGTWSYKVVALLSDGAHTIAGPAGTTTNGEQTLDATNKNSLTWAAVPGAHSYDVYRTAVAFSPATLGKIANVTTNAYADTGAVGDGSTPPVKNTTGGLTGRVLDKGGQVVNVKALTGYVDDAPGGDLAIQEALDFAVAIGCRSVLLQGIFRFDTAGIVIPSGITFKGDGWVNSGPGPGGAIVGAAPTVGAWLHVVGTGFKAITIAPNAQGVHIEKIGIYYDQPAVAPGWAPTTYPPAIYFTQAGSLFIENVMLLNPTHGIKQDSLVSSVASGVININNLFMSPFTVGISMEFIADVCRIENVHIWPFWDNNAIVQNYMQANLTGFDLAGVENCQLQNIFAYGANILFDLHKRADDTGPVVKLRASNVDADFSNTLVKSQGDCSSTWTNVRIGGGGTAQPMFDVLNNSNAIQVSGLFGDNLPAQIVKVNGVGNTIQILNSFVYVWGTAGAVPGIECSSDDNKINLVNFHFDNAGMPDRPAFGGAGIAAISRLQGSHTAAYIAGKAAPSYLNGDLEIRGDLILAGTPTARIPFVTSIPGLNLKVVSSVNILTVPAGKSFHVISAWAVLTDVSGYSSAVLPRVNIDAGPGQPFMAESAPDATWNAVGRSLPILPAPAGTDSDAAAGQTVRALSVFANTSDILTAAVHVLGVFY